MPMHDQAVQSAFQRLVALLEQPPSYTAAADAAGDSGGGGGGAAAAAAASPGSRIGREAPELEDVDFLPGDREDLPALTVVEGHVGIAMWAVPALCKLAMKTFSELLASENAARGSGCSADTCSKVVLLIAADHNSVWNKRKSWLQQKLDALRSAAGFRRRRRQRSRLHRSAASKGSADGRSCGDELLHLIRLELAFNALVLTKHPKSAATWSHRGWLLRQVVDDLRGSSQVGVSSKAKATAPQGVQDNLLHAEILVQELDVCQRASDQHPRCYYAWIHRLQAAKELPLSCVGREFLRVKKWLSTNVSDASAVHYLAQLQQLHLWRPCPSLSGTVPRAASAPQVLRRGGVGYPSPLQRMQAAQSHTLSTVMLSRRYPGHEALWAGRRAEFNLHVDMLLRHSPTAAHAQFHCQSIAAAVDAAALELDQFHSADAASGFDDSGSKDAVLLHLCCLWYCFALRRAIRDVPEAARGRLARALARADEAHASFGRSRTSADSRAHDIVAVCARVAERARQARQAPAGEACPEQ